MQNSEQPTNSSKPDSQGHCAPASGSAPWFILSWDRDPQPCEDWSFPYRVVRGAKKDAVAYADRLRKEKGGVWSVQEINGDGTPFVVLPNTVVSQPRGQTPE